MKNTKEYNVVINGVSYQWDIEKEQLNINKHGVSFTEAASVFEDLNMLMIADSYHSTDEDRFIALGMSCNASLLLVCHCLRGNDDIIRIFSARKAESYEETIYNKEYFRKQEDNR